MENSDGNCGCCHCLFRYLVPFVTGWLLIQTACMYLAFSVVDDIEACHARRFYLILLTSNITGLNPSVQQKTPDPFSSIQGKFPPNLNVTTALQRSSQAQEQNPLGINPSSSTMNSWRILNRLHASIACPIGDLSPKICFESVSFKTVIFTRLLSTIRSPLLLLFNILINLDLHLLLLHLFLVCSMHAFRVEEREVYGLPLHLNTTLIRTDAHILCIQSPKVVI